MKFKSIFICLFLGLSLIACKSKNKEDQPEKEQELQEIPDQSATSENSLDWDGTYAGTLPCADCPGIETKLTLHQDQTYKLEMEYLERETDFTEKGTFEWNDSGSEIQLTDEEGEDSAHYKVGENQLFLLDEKGERITGELESYYILEKIPE